MLLLSPSIAQAVESTPLLDELRSAYSQAVADVATAQGNVDSAMSARDAAQQAYYDALDQAADQVDKGSFGFFEYVGATDALDALNNSTYAYLTQQGDESDATSLENMRASIQWMRACNSIRSSLGLGELTVTDELMAKAQADANYSDTELSHARQFNVGENLAWNYGSNPFIQWYDNEKVYFDNAWASITGGSASDAPVGAEAKSWYDSHESEVNAYLENAYPNKSVGHYMNVINSSYGTTGFAICTRGSMSNWNTYGQVFNFNSSDGMSVDEYEQRFLAYYDLVCGDLVAQEEAMALSEAEAAVSDMQAALESCIGTKDAALAALDDATDLSHATIEGVEPFKDYDGTPRTQDGLVVKLTVSNGAASETYTLVEGEDYTVSYSDNTNPGIATLTVAGTGQKGSGEFWGQTSTTFQIQTPVDPSGWQYSIENDYVMITGYIGTDSDVVIPSEIAGKPVVVIASFAFDCCNTFRSVVIPDSVTTIGACAFNRCENLVSVEIPDSVKVIGIQAFEGCEALESVTMPDSIERIDTSAFSGCSSLASIDIPDGLPYIAAGVFKGCSSLKSVVIPDWVTIIRYGAFGNCTSLASVEIPDSVTTISGHAFHGCSSLTSFEIPDSVTTIEEYAFYQCTSLASVTVPGSVENIGVSAFMSIAEGSIIYVPNQAMKDLLSGKYSTSSTTVVVTSGWQKINGAWYYFDGDGKLVIDDWVKDSKGYCYLDADGKMVTGTKWVKV
ncbi:MAG: leucine-rich repeat protein, partial [Coriobacteriales bacterium]|nr:leucine-rich repeat protein [Coriobacteriales bacterium]